MLSHPRPAWLTLYSIGAIGIAVLFMVPLLHTSALMRTLMMLFIVAALYGAIGMWISENSNALVMDQSDATETDFVIYRDVARQPEDATTSHSTPILEDTPDHQEAA